MKADRIPVENVIRPGKPRLVDARMYTAMRHAFLKALPTKEPGLPLAELFARVEPALPEALFPGGAKAGWWFKAVQLDLEAKGLARRTKTTPLRLHRGRVTKTLRV